MRYRRGVACRAAQANRKSRHINTLKDAFCRIRGGDVEHAAALDELDAIGAWIECAMRVDAAIYKKHGNTSQTVQSVKLPKVVRSPQRRNRELSGTSASLAMCGQPTVDGCKGNLRQLTPSTGSNLAKLDGLQTSHHNEAFSTERAICNRIDV